MKNGYGTCRGCGEQFVGLSTWTPRCMDYFICLNCGTMNWNIEWRLTLRELNRYRKCYGYSPIKSLPNIKLFRSAKTIGGRHKQNISHIKTERLLRRAQKFIEDSLLRRDRTVVLMDQKAFELSEKELRTIVRLSKRGDKSFHEGKLPINVIKKKSNPLENM